MDVVPIRVSSSSTESTRGDDDGERFQDEPGKAWGYYAADKTNLDNLGTLNLLTAELVKEAVAAEVQSGERIQLDWTLAGLRDPGFKRMGFERKQHDMTEKDGGWYGFDEEVAYNTQVSSQWDGFRHIGHRTNEGETEQSGLYYGGIKHSTICDPAFTSLGVDQWCKAGGIAGRGVLLDWLRWRRLTKPDEADMSPVVRAEISHLDLDKVALFQGTELRRGDILLVRTGFIAWYETATPAERKRSTQDRGDFLGIQASPGSVEWFWDHHFAAVGGDAVAFEACPLTVMDMKGGTSLHEWFLAQWGTPIGEMFDLEALSQKCDATGRWSFFLTSAPANIPSGVASPPNAIAFF